MSEQTIHVELSKRSYGIHIGPGLLSSGRGAAIVASVATGSRICIVTHPALEDMYAVPLAEQLARLGYHAVRVSIPAGERYKTLRAVERLYGIFLEAGLDRKSLVIAVGGGVLGDVVGFAAATYLRGIRIVQVPTTLLAQVDASVGGKTGVDLPEGKNLVGAFHQPSAVLIDPLTLQSLPSRELRSGLAEVIKYGIIYDRLLFDNLVECLPKRGFEDTEQITRAITRSCEIKAEVVSKDETEQGLRAILNFGHTVGHALEQVTQYRRYKHGEAISIGMITASIVGEKLGITPPQVTKSLAECLSLARLPVVFPCDIDGSEIVSACLRDKKTQDGQLTFVLAKSIGEVAVQSGVPSDIVEAAIAEHKGISDVA